MIANKDKYVIKAVTIPVVRSLGIGWPEFREILQRSWSQCTSCVNWMVSELYARDERRLPSMEKMPKMPRIYLYPEARQLFPDLPSRTVASLEQATKNKYHKRRYQIIWTGESSLPNARYPQPFVAHNQAWRACYVTAGKDSGDPVPCINVALIGKDRLELQLKGGPQFGRQLADFDKIVEGEAIQSELAIFRKRTQKANGVTGRDSGGSKVKYQIMIKMVAWFPKKTKRSGGTLYVKTGDDCFLYALDEKANKIRTWHCDQVRRWVCEHRRRLQRLSDDQKAEQRPVASFQSRRETMTLKFRNRIDTFEKETVAQVLGVCRRMRFEHLQYNDTVRSYLPNFDWSGFETKLSNKLKEYNITFDRSGDSKMPDTVRNNT